MPGDLIISPQTAKLTRDTETFGRMDPYVKVTLGGQTQKTNTHTDGGKHPAWNSSLKFYHKGEDIIQFDVWDKDHASKDDLIGSGTVAFSTIQQRNNQMNDWIPLTYKGKQAGQLLVNITFTPQQEFKPVFPSSQPVQQVIYTQPIMQPVQQFVPVQQQFQPQQFLQQQQIQYQQGGYPQQQQFVQQQQYPQQQFSQGGFQPQQQFQQGGYPQQQQFQQGGYPQQQQFQQGGYPQQQQFNQGGYPQQQQFQQGGFQQKFY